MLTSRFEAGVCEIIWLCFGFSNPQLRFLCSGSSEKGPHYLLGRFPGNTLKSFFFSAFFLALEPILYCRMIK